MKNSEIKNDFLEEMRSTLIGIRLLVIGYLIVRFLVFLIHDTAHLLTYLFSLKKSVAFYVVCPLTLASLGILFGIHRLRFPKTQPTPETQTTTEPDNEKTTRKTE